MYHLYLVVYTDSYLSEYFLKNYHDDYQDYEHIGDEAYHTFLDTINIIKKLRSRVFYVNYNCLVYLTNRNLDSLREDIFPKSSIILKVKPDDLINLVNDNNRKYFDYLIDRYNFYNRVSQNPDRPAFDLVSENPLLYNPVYLKIKQSDFAVGYDSADSAAYETIVKIISHLLKIGHSKENLSDILFLLKHPFMKLGNSFFNLEASQTYANRSFITYSIYYDSKGLSFDISGAIWSEKVGYDSYNYNYYPGESYEYYEESLKQYITMYEREAFHIDEFYHNFINCDDISYDSYIKDLDSSDIIIEF